MSKTFRYDPESEDRFETRLERRTAKRVRRAECGDAGLEIQDVKPKREPDEITLECDFERRGAPLVVFTDELVERDGKPYYGEHYEVVAFEEGCNVWHNTPTGELDPKRALKTCKLHFESIPTPNRSRVTLTVRFLDGGIKVVMNGSEFSLDIPGMPKEFAFGITACEGINRLYSLTVKSKNA